MNWRELARKPFHALGIETPGESARLIWRSIIGKPYYWARFPLVVQFDTNNYCGPKYCGILCEYCTPQRLILQGKMRHAEMPLDQIKWILRQIAMHSQELHEARKYGFGYYAPFLYGEVLTDPRLPEILNLGKQYMPSITNNLFTSGVLPENAWMLLENLDWICVTFSAHTRELYKRVHRGDKFREVIETMRYLTENRKPHQRLDVHYVITKTNFAYMQDWYAFIGKEFPEWHRVFSPIVEGYGTVASYEAVGNLTMQQQAEAIRKVDPHAAFWNINTTILRQPCVLWHNASITADGTLLQCCTFANPKEWNYGNIQDYIDNGYGLEDYWRMKLANRLNNVWCRNCNLRRPDWRKRASNIQLNVHVKP